MAAAHLLHAAQAAAKNAALTVEPIAAVQTRSAALASAATKTESVVAADAAPRARPRAIPARELLVRRNLEAFRRLRLLRFTDRCSAVTTWLAGLTRSLVSGVPQK